jgi:hypothetical protein
MHIFFIMGSLAISQRNWEMCHMNKFVLIKKAILTLHDCLRTGVTSPSSFIAILFIMFSNLTLPIHAIGQPGDAIKQLKHASIESWPKQPAPYADFDWKKRFLAFDAYIFDWDKKSTFPTIKLDTTHYNMESNTVYIPAYYGDGRIKYDGAQDGLTFIALVAGSTLCGREKDSVPVGDDIYNYVNMLRTFKHDYGKRKIVYSFPRPNHDRNHADWWYDVGPSLLYYIVGDLYPKEPGMDERLRDVADGFYEMVYHLGGENANFWHQAYNFDMNRPLNSITWNGITASWKCPEVGVIAAAIEYWAYKKFGDKKYLDAAKWCMDYYERLDKNPYYEISLSLGPYIASMMNAEVGTNYDAVKYFDWLLKDSDARIGYGTAEANWNGYDVYGLVGSREDTGGAGYVFALETFANAFLAPAVKFDPRLARTVAKWLLNASNAARFFYIDQLPADKQYYGDTYLNAAENVIPYEGLRIEGAGQSPWATGDPVEYNKNWAALGTTFNVGEECTNLSIYGGAWAGFFGAIIKNTNVSKILRIDLNKLDFYKSGTSYPTYLYYNPYESKKSVRIDLEKPSDLYDILTGKFIARNASGKTSFKIGADDVVSLVVVPPDSKVNYDDNKIMINGTIVSYNPGNPK